MMVRYLVLHLLARLLHIQLEGNGQDEEEGIKVDMRIKTKKKRRQEVNDGKVENTGGVAAEGWKKGWEEEEEKSVENWTTLIGLELGARLARLENLFFRFLSRTAAQVGIKSGSKLGSSPETSRGGGSKGTA